MKVCVYTICKNEINNVDKWLECMKYADYMVILDTGSTDGTYEKLLKLQSTYKNLKLYRKEIVPFRFDVARNEAKKLVPSDTDIYVSMDLDESFKSNNWCNYLKSKWQSNYELGTLIYVDNKENNIYEQRSAMPRTKIHTKNAFWKYPLHELLVTNEEDIMSGDSLPEENHLKTWMLDLREPNWDSLIVFHNSTKSSTPMYKELADLRMIEYPGDFSTYVKIQELFRNKNYIECYQAIIKALKEINDYTSNLYFFKGYIEKYLFNSISQATNSFEKSLDAVNKSSMYELCKIYKDLKEEYKIQQILGFLNEHDWFTNRFKRYVNQYNDLENFLNNELKSFN